MPGPCVRPTSESMQTVGVEVSVKLMQALPSPASALMLRQTAPRLAQLAFPSGNQPDDLQKHHRCGNLARRLVRFGAPSSAEACNPDSCGCDTEKQRGSKPADGPDTRKSGPQKGRFKSYSTCLYSTQLDLINI